MEEEIKKLILMGENVNTEFKEARGGLPKNLFETVCAFLNTIGGYIILGVNDNKEIVGINKAEEEKIKKDYANLCNNKEVLNPTIISNLESIDIDGKRILYANIKESNSLHKCRGKVFYRNYEGDFDITDNINLIMGIHNHKSKIYDEDRVYPYIDVEKDLNHELFERARYLANTNLNNKRRHPWLDMSDLEMLKSAGFYKKDELTGKFGVTLAGILIFGYDLTIKMTTSLCRTDAILRIDDLDRYDDRDWIETNLIDMYERLFDFVVKYTKDRFTLDYNAMRVSSRNIFVKEMILNTIMHRSYTDPHMSRIIIYEDKLVCENPNSFGTMKIIDENNYVPITKNPNIANFFKEIGLADELGTGIRKITKYSYLYSGQYPVFEDKDIFRVTIPLNKVMVTSDIDTTKYDEMVNNKVKNDPVNSKNDPVNSKNDPVNSKNDPVNSKNDPVNSKNDIKNIMLDVIRNDNTITIFQLSTKLSKSEKTIKRYLKELKDNGYIERIGSDKNGTWKVLK